MKSAICTLFEGHYHHGVAALVNSLHKNNFRGDVYVGYRGDLPKWALQGKIDPIGKWTNAVVLKRNTGIKLIFLELKTTYSLTNYKPDFMLKLWEGPAKDADAFFYFDPDIVVNETWSCFEQWVGCGVALCEDLNSPLQKYHPRRMGWKSYFKSHNIDLQFKNSIYANGGFVGALKSDISFLNLWIKIQEAMGEAIGGLENSIFSNQGYDSTILKMEGFQIFDKSDQDALNAAIETYKGNISFMGKEGMGFSLASPMMYHALGSPKPWKANYFLRTLKGRPPRKEDVAFWENAETPYKSYPKNKILGKKFGIKISKVLGRFYKI